MAPFLSNAATLALSLLSILPGETFFAPAPSRNNIRRRHHQQDKSTYKSIVFEPTVQVPKAKNGLFQTIDDALFETPSKSVPSVATAGKKPKRIILIRHQRSLGNEDPKAYTYLPDSKVPLTDTGKSDAAKVTGIELAKLLENEKNVKFYTSPYTRTRETAEIVKSCCSDIEEVIEESPELVEQQFGNFQDKDAILQSKDERRQYGAFFYRFPNGESGMDVYNRVAQFIDRLHRSFIRREHYSSNENESSSEDDYNIVIVTHGLTLRLFLMRWFHFTVEEFEASKNPENGEIIVMDLSNRANVGGDGTTRSYTLADKYRKALGFPLNKH